MVKEHPLSNQEAGIHAGFAPKWSGPYEVLLSVGKNRVYWINKRGKPLKVHIDNMRDAPLTQDVNTEVVLPLPEPDVEVQMEEIAHTEAGD
jgi:hypothetical protein